MTKLHQLLAIEKDLRSKLADEIKRVTGVFQNATGQFSALSKSYTPKKDGDNLYQGETKQLASKVMDELDDVAAAWLAATNATVSKEASNCKTSADVTVAGSVILKDMPTGALLALETALIDLRRAFSAAPVLKMADPWQPSDQKGVYEMRYQTYRYHKQTRGVELSAATPQHPAQVKEVTDELIEGTWNVIELSSMITPTNKAMYLGRIDALLLAVKQARELGNGIDVVVKEPAATLLDFVLNGPKAA